MNPNICNHCGCETEYRDGRRFCPICGAYGARTVSEEETILISHAFQKLRLYEFDEAEREFEEMIRKYPRNPEGYWGRLMAKYGVKYEWTSEGMKKPSADVPFEKSPMEQEDYLMATAFADEAEKAYYREQAQWLDRFRDVSPKTDRRSDSEASVKENTGKSKRPRRIFFLIAGAVLLLALLSVLALLLLRPKACIHEAAVDEAVLPTCTQQGKTEWTYCALCGEVLVPYEVIPALGHTAAPDRICTEAQICTVCNAVLAPAHAHTPGEAATCYAGQLCTVCGAEIAPPSHVPGPPATCTEEQSCTLCGLVLDPGGHKPEPATCTSGSYCTVCFAELSGPLSHVPGPSATCTSGQYCTLCGAELASDIGHSPNRSADCTQDSVCLTCGAILEKAHGHTLSEMLGCTVGQSCLVCYQEIVPPTAHTPGPPATCTEGQVCLACDLDLAPPLEHSVTAWTVDKEPSLGTEGSKHGVCSRCNEEVREEIAALYSEGLQYILNADGTYAIGGVGTCTDAWIVLPSEHEGIPVTAIADNAFYNCTFLTEITVPKGIASIGNFAFYLCKNLKSIVLPEGVTYLGDSVFSGCVSMASVTLPKGVTSIGTNAFSGCGSLTSIEIPKGVTGIGSSAFANCNRLQSVGIPESVTSIGSRAFYYCGSLTEIDIPDNVVSIGDQAFYFCGGLRSISVSAALKNIGDCAFYRCTSLVEFSLPETVSSIGDYAFSLCIGIEEIEIPANVTSVGAFAFDGCRRLKTVVFKGTAAQWEKLAVGEGWLLDVPADKIVCSDGEILR